MRYEKQTFDGEQLIGPVAVEGHVFKKCVFVSCNMHSARGVAWSEVSDVTLEDCNAKNCSILKTIVRDCTLRNFKTKGGGRACVISKCILENVVLEGHVSGLVFAGLGSDLSDQETIFEMRAYYDSMNTYAVDIRNAQVGDVAFVSIPGRLVLIGKDDALMTLEGARRAVADSGFLKSTFPEMGFVVAEYYANHLLRAEWLGTLALPHPKASKNSAQSLDEMRRLIELGYLRASES